MPGHRPPPPPSGPPRPGAVPRPAPSNIAALPVPSSAGPCRAAGRIWPSPPPGGQLAPGRLKLLPGLGKAPVQLSLGQSAVVARSAASRSLRADRAVRSPSSRAMRPDSSSNCSRAWSTSRSSPSSLGISPTLRLTFRRLSHSRSLPSVWGVGHVLLPGGHQRGNTPLQLRGRCNRQISTRSNEGRPLKDLPSHTGEQLAAVGGSQAGDRLLRPGVDGGKGPEGSAALGTPAEGDVPALATPGP